MRHGSQKLGYVLLVSLATLIGVLGSDTPSKPGRSRTTQMRLRASRR